MNDFATGDERDRLMELFDGLVASGEGLPDPNTDLGRVTREFFANNWQTCRDGLLAHASKVRVWPRPQDSSSPHWFRFEIDRPYKRRKSIHSPIEIVAGPVRGRLWYRPDLFKCMDSPVIAVALDREQAFFHPNCSRKSGAVCLGSLPKSPYPFPLDLLLENVLFPIISYVQRRPSDPFDLEAAAYFALAPDAMQGLEPVEPLY